MTRRCRATVVRRQIHFHQRQILNHANNMKKYLSFSIVLAVIALFTGCASDNGVYRPLDTNRNDLENSDRFVLLTKKSQKQVTTDGIQERTTDDGRLQVIASIRSRSRSPIEVQVNCIFKNAQGMETETMPLQTVHFSARRLWRQYAHEPVTFTAMKPESKRYSIRAQVKE